MYQVYYSQIGQTVADVLEFDCMIEASKKARAMRDNDLIVTLINISDNMKRFF